MAWFFFSFFFFPQLEINLVVLVGAFFTNNCSLQTRNKALKQEGEDPELEKQGNKSLSPGVSF